MVIAEVKFRPPPDWQKFVEPRRVKEVYGISPLVAIRPGSKNDERRPPPGKRYEPESEGQLHRALALMIDQANSNLQQLGLDVHISLVRHDKGFALDIYDCRSGSLCEMIGKEQVSLAELPVLLTNLHQQVGLLIDEQV